MENDRTFYLKVPTQGWDSSNQWHDPSYVELPHFLAKHSMWLHGWHPLIKEGFDSTETLVSMNEPQKPSGRSYIHDAPPSRAQTEAAAFVRRLRVCTKTKDLRQGQAIHDAIVKRRLFVECSDALIIMYASCGELEKARALLDAHNSKDIIAWTALIAGYARLGQEQDAISCFERMQIEGIPRNKVTYLSALKACASMKAAEIGNAIHDEIARCGLQDDVKLATALVDMYAKCGYLSKALDVFNQLNVRDVVAWNALIFGYVKKGYDSKGLECFNLMEKEGVLADEVTYLAILKACASIGDIDRGREIHDALTKQGLLENNILLGSSLVDMYTKCNALSEAQALLENLPFRDVVLWSALVAGYAQAGQGDKALECYERMQNEGIFPNAVTYTCILKACAIVGDSVKGEQIHDEIVKRGMLKDNVMLGSSLIHMYAKCGAFSKAESVLGNLLVRDVVCWNAIITGYVLVDKCEQAICCFKRMKDEGISPDDVTYACILKAYTILGDISSGKQIHEEVAKQGLLLHNVVLGNCLVEMYAKCGDLSKAQNILDHLPSRDVVSWSALMTGYVQEGLGEKALNCLKLMQHEGITPNIVIFNCALNACNHLGWIDEGHKIFINMMGYHGLKPNIECYTSLIDLCGRAGHLPKVVQLIQEMPAFECDEIWLVLMSACQKWGDVEVGEWAFKKAIKIDKSSGPAYVLMANIYSAAGMQESADITKSMAKAAHEDSV
ncbi:hypothetical protein KP509_23G076700 [Ceratopteris richardii]|nr:hypothetical protein KP509_23G076700 [Ceratopteris richardii]